MRVKVHGIQGLRVADGSIMPSLPSGNTMAPIIMIAERGAEFIITRHQLFKKGTQVPGGQLGNRFGSPDSQNSEDVSGNYASNEGGNHNWHHGGYGGHSGYHGPATNIPENQTNKNYRWEHRWKPWDKNWQPEWQNNKNQDWHKNWQQNDKHQSR